MSVELISVLTAIVAGAPQSTLAAMVLVPAESVHENPGLRLTDRNRVPCCISCDAPLDHFPVRCDPENGTSGVLNR